MPTILLFLGLTFFYEKKTAKNFQSVGVYAKYLKTLGH